MINETRADGCVTEGDSKGVINLLRGQVSLHHSFTHILDDVLQLQRQAKIKEFRCVSRVGNGVAHRVTKWSLTA